MYDELRHHGILGQKWGVRRYQNSDGSLTTAGKKRYRGWVKEAIDADLASMTSVKALTNKQLTEANKRYTLEEKYTSNYPKGISKAQKKAAGVIATVTALGATYGAFKKYAKNGKNLFNKAMDSGKFDKLWNKAADLVIKEIKF